MAADNEHINLRRRMEARLGRPISPTAWDVASEREYVKVALDPTYDTGVDELANFLGDLLRVEDNAPQPLASRARTREPRVLQTPELSARIDAISRLAAEHASGDEGVLRFRQRVLGRDTPMSPSEAEAYLDLPDARRPPRTGDSGERLEVLHYQNRRIDHDIHVWPRTPLDRLRELALSLCESYPWEPAQAAAFVLEGLVPRATPFLLNLPQTLHETRPRRARMIMKVDLWMPAALVLRAYRESQRRVLPGHNRPISARSVDLVNFVLRHRPATTWQQLLDRWNTEHPTMRYADFRRFHTAYDRAQRSLLHPRYRTYIDAGGTTRRDP